MINSARLWRCVTLFVSMVALATLGCSDSGAGRDKGDATVDAGAGGAGGDDAGGGGGGGGGAGGAINDTCSNDQSCADDQYCEVIEGDLEGNCVDGCRGDDSCAPGQTCNPGSHTCEDGPCVADDACGAGEFCNLATGECEAGCRADGGGCEAGEMCNPDTRDCEASVVCCMGGSMCAVVAPDGCDDDANLRPASASCASDPCGDRCPEGDGDCPADRYCDADGVCVIGCRPGDRNACPDGQGCDPEKHTCERQDCQANDECGELQFCDTGAGEGFCTEGCNSDEQCGDGLACVNGDCGDFCPQDGDCGEGRHCDESSGLCQDDCSGDEDCRANEFCDVDSGMCVVGCRNDDDEPNDIFADATVIPLENVGMQAVVVEDHQICGGDEDYFRFEVPAGGIFQVRLSFQHGQGDLNLQVYNEAEELLGESATLLDPELVAIQENAFGGTFYVRVYGADEDVENDYNLLINVIIGDDACFDDEVDALETPDSTDDDPDSAPTRIGAVGDALLIEVFDRALCPGDVDWFCFDMDTDDGLEVEVVGGAGGGDIIAEVFSDFTRTNQGLAQPEYATEANGNDRWTLAVASNTGGFLQAGNSSEWCIRVQGDRQDANREYTLTVTFSRNAQICDPDEAEPNDVRGDATNLMALANLINQNDNQLRVGQDLEVEIGLRVCPGDRDFFRLTATEGNILRVWADVAGPLALPLHIRLLDAAGVPVGNESAGVDGEIEAHLNGTADGEYFIELWGEQRVQGDYTLFVRRETPQGCGADAAESGAGARRNDTPQTATQLMSLNDEGRRYTFQEGVLCNTMPDVGDEDWYCFDVAEDDSRIVVDADFDHQTVDVQIELYRQQGLQVGAPIEESSTMRDGELINVFKQTIDAGAHCVRVYGQDLAEGPYQLTVTVVPEEPICLPDYQEGVDGNNGLNDPTDLGGGSHQIGDVWICSDLDDPNNERETGDYFSIQVPPGSSVTAHIEFLNNVDGHLLLNGYNLDGAMPVLRTGSLAAGNFQCINIENPSATDREVLLQVKTDQFIRDNDARVDYVIRVFPTELQGCDPLDTGFGNRQCDAIGECDVLSRLMDSGFAWTYMPLGPDM